MSDKYIPEEWVVRKDDIYEAINGLEIAARYIVDTPTSNVQFMRQKDADLRTVIQAFDRLRQYPKRGRYE